MKIKTYGNTSVCQNEKCHFSSECANHETAGEFRSESGFTPQLTLWPDKSIDCETGDRSCHRDIHNQPNYKLPNNIEYLHHGFININDINVIVTVKYPPRIKRITKLLNQLGFTVTMMKPETQEGPVISRNKYSYIRDKHREYAFIVTHKYSDMTNVVPLSVLERNKSVMGTLKYIVDGFLKNSY